MVDYKINIIKYSSRNVSVDFFRASMNVFSHFCIIQVDIMRRNAKLILI